MKLNHYFLAFFTSIIWGGNFVATKYGVDGFGIFGLSLIRVTAVSLLLAPYIRINSSNYKPLIKIALVYGLGFLTCVNIAVQYTSSLPLIVILIQLTVPFGAILSYFYFNEKITWPDIIGMIIAFIGVVVLVGIPSSFDSLISIIAILIASFCYSLQMVLSKKYAAKIETKNLIASTHILNIPLFVILSLFFGELSLSNFKQAGIVEWGSALYTGLISTLVGFTIWFGLLKKYPVNKVTPFMLFVPLFGILFSIICFDSTITKEFIIGGALIIAGVATIQFCHLILPKNIVGKK